MVAPNESTSGAIFQPQWAQAYLRQRFQQMGVNPNNNMWARMVMERANQAVYMMNAMGLDEAQARPFLDSWLNARWGNSGQSFNGTDLSRAGQAQWLNNAMASTDQSTPDAQAQYAFFNTGDPNDDYNNLRAAREIQYGGRAPGYQQAQQRVLGNWFGNVQSGMLENPNASTNVLDWLYNRAPSAGPPVTAPPGTPAAPAGGAAATTPTGAQTQAQSVYQPTAGTTPTFTPQAAGTTPTYTPQAASTSYGVSAAGPQGSLTPPVRPTGYAPTDNMGIPLDSNAPVGPGGPAPSPPTGWVPPVGGPYGAPGTGQQTPTTVPGAPGTALPERTYVPPGTPGAGQYTYPENPNRTAPGANAPITSWKQLLEKYRSDQKNWGTRGFRPTPQAFSIGGMSYNPQADQVQGWNNMSGQGRVTNRGNFMGQFLYYLDLLMRQRDAGGNAAIGLTGQMNDDQVARIAWQRMQKNAIGSTGMTG